MIFFLRIIPEIKLEMTCLYFIFLIFHNPVFSFSIESANPRDNTATRRMGLFISSEKGGPDRGNLKYSFSDALKLSQVIKELGGLNTSDYQLLRNPDRNKLFDIFTQFKQKIINGQENTQQVKVKTEFFLYYSGHSDEQGIFLNTEKVSYLELKTFIDNIQADMAIMILDSCASGAITQIKGGALALPFTIDRSQDTRGKAIITACSSDEVAQESDNLQASFFTYYLISGLRGAADQNEDNKITLNEAYKFAYDETLRRTEDTLGGPMHPSYSFSMHGRGDLLLTDINTTDQGIILNESLAGRVYIRDAQGKLLIEFNKLPDKEVTIAIPAGEYKISLYQKNKTMQCNINIGKHSDAKGGSQPDFVLIVKDKEKINFKGQVKILEPDTEAEPAYYTSLGVGYGLSIPVNNTMKDYFEIGQMPLLIYYFNFPFTWGIGSFELTTGISINNMKDELINGCLLYSFPLGIGLQYKTNFIKPLYLFVDVTGGLTFNLFVYRENVAKQNDFRITSFFSSSLGMGINFSHEFNISFFSNLLFLIFQDRQCITFSPGIQIEYCFY